MDGNYETRDVEHTILCRTKTVAEKGEMVEVVEVGRGTAWQATHLRAKAHRHLEPGEIIESVLVVKPSQR